MPDITVSIPHQLERAEARRRIEQGLANLQQQYAGPVGRLTHAWNGDTMDFALSVLGTSLRGEARVEDRQVCIRVSVPWALAMLAGGIKPAIEREAGNLLRADPSPPS
jgi:hypothetical protein